MPSKLEQLAAMTVIVADTGDLDQVAEGAERHQAGRCLAVASSKPIHRGAGQHGLADTGWADEHCAELLGRYAAAGCSRIHVWPLGNEVAQLDRLVDAVLPRIDA